MLRDNGVSPLLVFDGQRLPMKAAEHAARAENRDNARAEATRMMASGDRDGAEKAYQRCISVTPQMAKQVMKVGKGYLHRNAESTRICFPMVMQGPQGVYGA